MTLALRSEAEADIFDAFRWYESKRAGLGHAFVDEVDGAFERITQTPTAFALVHRDVRRLVLRRFPYVVYFREVDDIVEVVGVLSGRRDLGTMRKRASTK